MQWLGKFWRDEGAATAALYALALPALVGAVGIGFDYARVASMDSELQNAADQAALAGATQLDQLAGSVSRATTAARNGLATNSTFFANDGQGATIAVPEERVFFYETKADAEASSNPIDITDSDADFRARFIRVGVATRTANYALTPVVGALSGTIDAEAVAGIGSAICRIPPLMICNPEELDSNTDPSVDFNADNYKGVGLLVVQQGKWEPGAFGFLDLGKGANGVEQGLGWVSPVGNCVPVNGPEVIELDIEPGLKTSAIDAVNTRFDIYDNCPSGGDCPASINSIKDVTHNANLTANKSCTYGQNGELAGWQEPASAGRYLPPSNAPLPPTTTPTSMGHPRDICHSLDPYACGRFGDAFWDRDAYFRSQHGWSASEWPTNTGFTRIDPTTRPRTPTRYEVYRWEITNRDVEFGGQKVLRSRTVGARNNHARPVCSPGQGFGNGTVPATGVSDRRRVSVAVINCKAENVGGKREPYPIRKFVDVFLVQPSLNRERTDKKDIYVEIIGDSDVTSNGTTAGAVIRRDVPFLVK